LNGGGFDFHFRDNQRLMPASETAEERIVAFLGIQGGGRTVSRHDLIIVRERRELFKGILLGVRIAGINIAPADAVLEKCVSGKHQLFAAFGVIAEETNAARGMTGSMQDFESEIFKGEKVAVFDEMIRFTRGKRAFRGKKGERAHAVCKHGLIGFVDINFRAGALFQCRGGSGVVKMPVGEQYMLYRKSRLLRFGEYGVRIIGRVNYGGGYQIPPVGIYGSAGRYDIAVGTKPRQH